MTFAAACGWALCRSLIVAFAAWPIAETCARWLRTANRSKRWLLWGAFCLPWIMPGMLVGYAYNGWVLYLAGAEFWKQSPWSSLEPLRRTISTHDAVLNELLLGLLLLARIVPVGIAVARFWPAPATSAQAVYLRRLGLPQTLAWWRRLGVEIALLARRRWRSAVPAIGLMFLLAFQEFELVARLSRPSWTVWLIDAQATGLTLAGSLTRGILPAMCELLVLLPVCGVLWRMRRPRVDAEDTLAGVSSWEQRGVAAFAAIALLLVIVVPVVWIGPSLPAGVTALWRQPTTLLTLMRQIAIGLLVAGLATAGAVALARQSGRLSRTPLGLLVMTGLGLPGLLGALLLSLALLEALRGLGPVGLVWQGWERTTIPWIVGQFLLLVPRTLCLQALVSWSEDGPALHTARILAGARDGARARRGRDLVWRLAGQKHLAAGWLLWYGAYLDLATGQLLAPPGMASAPVTLYIQMHYGRNAVLSAMTAITMLAPVLLAGMALAVRPWVVRGSTQ